jgi:zona occludens toxin
MLVFNEGVPRAGKSYDAVKSHILPALAKGRRVFARLNGLRHDKIAAHLGVAESDVRALLVTVDTKDVKSFFACSRDEQSGAWCIPDEFKDSLIVIDEVHEFYVNERKPLPPEIENFWALLGQNGGDAVILTQWINRLHTAVKARIEKKNSFQKLSAVGMKGRYRVTYFQTVSAGKFEKIGGATLKYDPKIFPLYDGYAPGAENVEVYEEGSKSVWAAMAFRAVIFVVVGGVGLYFFLSFFNKGKKPDPHKDAPVAAQTTVGQGTQVFDVDGNFLRSEGTEGATGALQGVSPVPALPAPDPLADLRPEQRYVVELRDRGRIRLAAVAQVGTRTRAWVQWIDTGNNVVEQLELAQLEALGFDVSVELYGVRIASGEHVLVATAWPYVAPQREADPRLYNLSSGGTAGVASVASDDGGAAAPGVVIGHTSGKRADVFPRNPAATISGYTPPTSTL